MMQILRCRILISLALLMPVFSLNIHTAYGYDPRVDSPPDMFGGPGKGEKAPDFILKTLEGQTAALSQYLEKGPVVLEFGSYTCPIFRQRHPAVEKLREKYGGRVSFITIYTLEAHPKGDACPYMPGREWVTPDNEERGILYRQPRQEAERAELVKKASDDLGMQTLVVLDDMSNSTWKAYGGAPNAAYLIGRDGQVKLRQGWFEAKGLEKALAQEMI